mgnify:FL=1
MRNPSPLTPPHLSHPSLSPSSHYLVVMIIIIILRVILSSLLLLLLVSFQCFKGCLKEPFEKFGYCPDSFDNIPVFVQACVFFCTDDRDCPSTEKCCLHSCGQTCKPALGLFNENHLPPVPYNLTVKEKKRKNGVHLSWEFDSLNKNQT